MAKFTLSPGDPRNPQKYELRAGYPKPDTAWFMNYNAKSQPQRMDWSREKFVTGFNLTISDYYDLRLKAIELVMKSGLHHPSNNLGSLKCQIEIAEIKSEIKKLPAIKTKRDPTVYWRNQFTGLFLTTGVIAWMREYPDYWAHGIPKEQGLDLDTKWKFGPERLSAKSFNGIFQLQHLTIDLEYPEGKFSTIPVRSIGIDREKPITPVDVPLETLSYELFEQELRKINSLEWNENDKLFTIVYTNPSNLRNPKGFVQVQNDASLQSAILALQVPGSSRIPLKIIQGNPLASETGSHISKKSRKRTVEANGQGTDQSPRKKKLKISSL